MIPHERSLVNRLEDKPFVLLGVNSDRDPEKLKKDLKENQVTWRSFQNQRKEGKAIAEEWNVQGWPTLYLIDHKGNTLDWRAPECRARSRNRHAHRSEAFGKVKIETSRLTRLSYRGFRD